MEFFDWLNVPWLVANYLELTVDSAEEAAALTMRIMMISAIVAAALYLVGLVCGGFGLMKLAKRQGIKYWWIGFLPFANTYLVGKLAGETRFFGQKCKRLGLYTMLVEIVYVILNIALLVISFLLIDAQFYDLFDAGSYVYYDFSKDLFLAQWGYKYSWILTMQNVLEIIEYIWWVLTFLMMCSLFTAFFRKYYARSPFLMTFLCAFLPLRGFVLLAVRNNNPVDYASYQQRRYEEMRRAQYGDEGGNRPFTDFGNGSGGSNGGDPFSEFGGNNNSNGSSGSSGSSGDSPFDDF